MARKASIVKDARRKEEILKKLAEGKQPKFRTRITNRCNLCGRRHGYLRKFDICRICLREKASEGLIMGMTKSSW